MNGINLTKFLQFQYLFLAAVGYRVYHLKPRQLAHNTNFKHRFDRSAQLYSDVNKKELEEYGISAQFEEYPTNPLDMYGSMEDDEVIEALRLERLLDNDRWQTTHFRDNQGGEWTGESFDDIIFLKACI
jgi:hypothetical protein